MDLAKIEDAVWEIAGKIATDAGCRVYDVEFVKEGADWFLRVFIDKDGGVFINDCETVSRALGDALDERDPIAQSYCLEVSSPGIERRLRKNEHFTDNIGKNVEIKLYSPINKKKVLIGKLVSFANNMISIENADGIINLEKNKIADAKLLWED